MSLIKVVLFLALVFLQCSWIHASQNDLINKSKKIYAQLKKNGHIQSDVAFFLNKDPALKNHIAYVEFDYATKKCSVFIDPDGLEAKQYTTDLQFKFILYHELAHCHLYSKPKDVKVFPQISDKANLLLSDWLKFTVFEIDSDLDKIRANGFFTHHETYADVKAIAMLLNEGVAAEELSFLKDLRIEKPSLSDTHNTHGVLDKVYGWGWQEKDYSTIDDEVRAVSDQHLADNYFKVHFNFQFFDSEAIRSWFEQQIRLVTFNFNYDSPTNDETQFLRKEIKRQLLSDDLPLKKLSEFIVQGYGEDEVVQNYYVQRYFLDVNLDDSVYEELLGQLTSLRESKLQVASAVGEKE